MNKEKVAENKVIIANGIMKTNLCKESEKRGMSVEEFRRLGHEKINKRFELLKQDGVIN